MISDFIFDGKALSDFGYMMIFENSEEVIDVSAMQFNTIKAALSDISHRVSYNYESNYTSTFLIMKSSCENNDETFLTNDDITELTRWLARKQYKWFRFIDDEDDDEIWYKVQIQVRKEYVGANVVGLQLTVTANAPYGFTREITYTPDRIINDIMNIQTDEEGYIYPDCEITVTSPGSVELAIFHGNGEIEGVTINNCVADEVITINGTTLQISSNKDHDFTNDFNYVFPRFTYVYGNAENGIWKVGTATYYITFKYRGIRKVGFNG